MVHKAKKVVIITEKLISDKVTDIIDECGATGYTITDAGGKGSRGIRSNRSSVTDAYVNVKIQVITASEEIANKIANRVAEEYFDNYSGITFLEDVEIIRPQKF